MLVLYKYITSLSAPILNALLNSRVNKGKELPQRLNERRGVSTKTRPQGQLIWIHAASVGEAQSALILIDKISSLNAQTNFLVTSGTVTSANLMKDRLPKNAIHQFYPLDHPKWVKRFLNHWQPDLVLWMESELWPNMLAQLKKGNIPALLINARLSDKSYSRWKFFKGSIQNLLSAFDTILAQTKTDETRFKNLGASYVVTTDNLKYSASPLPHDKQSLQSLKNTIDKRPFWLFASTHAGEEEMACRIHSNLKDTIPNILTIIVPRHPERGADIETQCNVMGMKTTRRSPDNTLPAKSTDIYLADTLGELGLFYRLSDIAVIGRSFSFDGGGGHNPIEAAQLNCAVLTGPNVQFQQQLFDEMKSQNAAIQCANEKALQDALLDLFNNPETKQHYISAAQNYASAKNHIIDKVMEHITPHLKHEGAAT